MINYKEKYLKYKKKYLKIKKMFGGNGINSYSIDKDPYFEDMRERIEDIKDEQKLTQMQNNFVCANKEVEEQIKLENERMRLEEQIKLENENNNSLLFGSGILLATITSVFLLLK